MKKQLKALTFVSLLMGAAQVQAAGGIVGNGGDSVRCRPRGDSFLNGLYNLDYLLTLKSYEKDCTVVRVKNWRESRERLLRNLKAKVPELVEGFEDFLKGLEHFEEGKSFQTLGSSQTGKRRIWVAAPGRLVQIRDEGFIKRLPPGCGLQGHRANENIGFFFIQTVIRKDFGPKIVYEYDKSIVDQLYSRKPLQFSFLAVHEWLWDLTSKPEVQRAVNRFLHSEDFELMSAEAVQERLRQLGLRY